MYAYQPPSKVVNFHSTTQVFGVLTESKLPSIHYTGVVTPAVQCMYMYQWVSKKWIISHLLFYWQNGDTPLHQAAFNGHLTTIKYLTGHGADVHAVNNVSSHRYLHTIQS